MIDCFFLTKISDWSDEMNDIFKDMQAKVGCEYISDLPSYKRKVWQEMKRLNPADYEERQLEDFSKYVFGMSYQTMGLNEQYEEYAIHDTNNFPIAIGEYVSIEELNEMYEMIEELPDYIVDCLDEFISHYGTLEEVVEHKQCQWEPRPALNAGSHNDHNSVLGSDPLLLSCSV